VRCIKVKQVNHILAYASALNTNAHELIMAEIIKQGNKNHIAVFQDMVTTSSKLSVSFWQFS